MGRSSPPRAHPPRPRVEGLGVEVRLLGSARAEREGDPGRQPLRAREPYRRGRRRLRLRHRPGRRSSGKRREGSTGQAIRARSRTCSPRDRAPSCGAMSGYGKFETRLTRLDGHEIWRQDFAGVGAIRPDGSIAMLAGSNESPAWDDWEYRQISPARQDRGHAPRERAGAGAAALPEGMAPCTSSGRSLPSTRPRPARTTRASSQCRRRFASSTSWGSRPSSRSTRPTSTATVRGDVPRRHAQDLRLVLVRGPRVRRRRHRLLRRNGPRGRRGLRSGEAEPEPQTRNLCNRAGGDGAP